MRRVSKCLVLLLAAGGAQAQLPADEAPLEEVVVNGEFPGPGMWKVTRADDPSGNTLWIIGDPPPLPKRIQWKSKEVEAVAGSGVAQREHEI